MATATKASTPAKADATDKETKDGKGQTIKIGGQTVKVVVEEEVKTSEELEQETHEALQKRQEARAEGDIGDAKVKVEEAETRLEEAKAALAETERAAKGDYKGSTKGGSSVLVEGEDLEEHQITHGQAPIAEGEYEPVDVDKAKTAKTNRGRGVGG